ncbi:FliA/WhiG family RNA polymerase sigma factor [Propionivibrio dicarboxylicus]|uniref:RNA polymerase sigma factor n=1 Tax=Propionivibrio dicarboxylicus TaxID=83767 RepID=A0A1G8HZP5_9RHOO|nr:FliA/WhiG family RNA polymerase sigma factor [Propionivibrio dicarboxylicus]SDI11910.1 RNA polymerase sigma factor for flagellar operon FliA [Propionivibrio dicarboxylicus]
MKAKPPRPPADDFANGTPRELFEAHSPLVRRIANSMARNFPDNVALDDLVQDGALGLLDAIVRHSKQVNSRQFQALAAKRIRGAILDGLRALDPAPPRIRRVMREAARATHQLQQELGRDPDEGEVALAIGLPLARYQRCLQLADGYTLLSLEDFEGETENGSYLEFCADNGSDPFVVLERKMFKRTLSDALERLPASEKTVVSAYYEEQRTMREIGATLGLSEGRISQIHTQAIVRLRAAILAGRSTPASLTPRRRPRGPDAQDARMPAG